MVGKVVFVCTGNICRSPLAELAARKQFANLGLEFCSAGLQAAPGLPASAHSRTVAQQWGYGLMAHAATSLDAHLAAEAAWLIGMTRSHGAVIRSRFAEVTCGGIGILGAPGLDLKRVRYSPAVPEVDDPYGESFGRYQACGRQIWDLVADWAKPFAMLAGKKESRTMKIAMGCDHRGYDHKQVLAEYLRELGHEVEDFGCHSSESADYPDAALPAAVMVSRGEAAAGVLICGSGIGMSIAANKAPGVRASLCFTPDQACTTRKHNDSNVLCLAGDAITAEAAVEVLRAWLAAEFEGGRHAKRVDKIVAFENDHLGQE